MTFPNRVLEFVHKGKNQKIVALEREETLPIVSDTSAGKAIKSIVSHKIGRAHV